MRRAATSASSSCWVGAGRGAEARFPTPPAKPCMHLSRHTAFPLSVELGLDLVMLQTERPSVLRLVSVRLPAEDTPRTYLVPMPRCERDFRAAVSPSARVVITGHDLSAPVLRSFPGRDDQPVGPSGSLSRVRVSALGYGFGTGRRRRPERRVLKSECITNRVAVVPNVGPRRNRMMAPLQEILCLPASQGAARQ